MVAPVRLKTGARLGAVVLAALAVRAEAHVKWFCDYHVAAQPLPLATLLCPSFFVLAAATGASLLLGAYIERTQLGQAAWRWLERRYAPLQNRTDDLLRAGVGAYFIALFALGGMILTPELKTASPVIPWVQAAIAVCLFGRRTRVLAALGIVALYLVALHDYGVFHLMDYPIFWGLAVYFFVCGRNGPFTVRPLEVVRWTLAISILWVSTEKWAYPNWIVPLLVKWPSLRMGIEPYFYLRAAGFVEFGLAFALLWTPLCRRLAAMVLVLLFALAVIKFGKIDAIGHLFIVAILLAILVDGKPLTRRAPLLAPLLFVAVLIADVAAYYSLHALLFGTSIW